MKIPIIKRKAASYSIPQVTNVISFSAFVERHVMFANVKLAITTTYRQNRNGNSL